MNRSSLGKVPHPVCLPIDSVGPSILQIIIEGLDQTAMADLISAVHITLSCFLEFFKWNLFAFKSYNSASGFWLPAEKWSTLQGKNLLPKGAKSFLVEWPFQKWLVLLESKQEGTKDVFLAKIAENLPCVSSFLKNGCSCVI